MLDGLVEKINSFIDDWSKEMKKDPFKTGLKAMLFIWIATEVVKAIKQERDDEDDDDDDDDDEE